MSRTDPGGRLMGGARLLLGILMLVNIALNFSNVVGRYVFLSPIIWAEEVMGYLLIWSVFVGAAIVTWEGDHLRMDLVFQALPERWRRLIEALVALAVLAASAFVLWQSWQVVRMIAAFGQKSMVAGVPMVVPHAAVPVGFALIVIAVVLRFRASLIARHT